LEKYIPFDELKAIKKVCDARSIKMHLDAARIYIAVGFGQVFRSKNIHLFLIRVYLAFTNYLGKQMVELIPLVEMRSL